MKTNKVRFKNRCLIGAALSLLVTCVLMLKIIGHSNSGSVKSASFLSRNSHDGTNTELADSTEHKSERGKVVDQKEQLLKISKLSGEIVRFMAADEASRATLVDQETTENSFIYYFEIRRNPEFNSLVDKICIELSEKEDVNTMALRKAVEPFLESFRIEEGLTQKLYVKVPQDPNEEVSYAMLTSPETDDPRKVTSSVGPAFGGRVSIEKPNWRYSRLLDLDIFGNGDPGDLER